MNIERQATFGWPAFFEFYGEAGWRKVLAAFHYLDEIGGNQPLLPISGRDARRQVLKPMDDFAALRCAASTGGIRNRELKFEGGIVKGDLLAGRDVSPGDYIYMRGAGVADGRPHNDIWFAGMI